MHTLATRELISSDAFACIYASLIIMGITREEVCYELVFNTLRTFFGFISAHTSRTGDRSVSCGHQQILH